SHRSGQPLPFAGLFQELLASLSGQRIEAGLTVILTNVPLGADPLLVFKALESKIERTMINEKDLFRLTLYGARYALPVTRAEHEGFENEQVERSLQEGDAIVGIVWDGHPTKGWLYCGSDVKRNWKWPFSPKTIPKVRRSVPRCPPIRMSSA